MSKLLDVIRQALVYILSNRMVFYPIFLLVLVLVGAGALKNIISPQRRTVTVVGTGSKTVKAAQGTVSFSLVYAGSSQSDTITTGEQRFNAVLGAIAGFNPKIEKTTYQVVQGSSASTFQYVNAAKVTLDDPGRISEVAKTLYSAGATLVTQPVYIPKDKERVDREVRDLALKDARDRVHQLARGSGAWVGNVVTIQEGGSTGQTGTSVSTTDQKNQGVNGLGDIEIQAAVTVTYELR